MKQKVVIRDVDLPRDNKVKEEVRWICDSLGLMSGRDTEDMSFKIMFDLLKNFSKHKIIPTEFVAESLKVEAPRINHHIRGLMESGILIREKRKIALRGGSLTSAIEEMQRDSERMFERLLEVSKEIDEVFGL